MSAKRENACMADLLVHGRRNVYLCEWDMVGQCGQCIDVCDFPEELGAEDYETTTSAFEYRALTL